MIQSKEPIKASELRIGNWVQITVNNKIYHVQVEWQTIKHLEKHTSSIYYSGVPITPEILEKAGFVYHKINGITSLEDNASTTEDHTYYWDLKVSRGHVYDGAIGELTLVKWGNNEEYFTFSSHWLRVKLYSLHQLQNLYFALTNQELNINL